MASDEYKEITLQASNLLIDFAKELTKSYTPKNDELREAITAALKIQADILNQTKLSFGPEFWKNYSYAGQACSDIIKSVSSELIKNYSDFDISQLVKTISNIRICDDYVSIPESIIPDNFQYEEVKNDSFSPSERFVVKPSSKHLSYTTTLALLAIIIPLHCWIISCIREDISSRQEQLRHEELISVLNESNRLQREEIKIQQEQLESVEKSLEFICTTYNTVQESCSNPLDTGSCSQCVHLQSEPVDLLNPTEAADSEGIDDETSNSESLSKPEP